VYSTVVVYIASYKSSTNYVIIFLAVLIKLFLF
jgi:hypothetical protein